MPKLLAIALVTWRQAVRSGLLAAGLGLLLLTAWGLPEVLHGDGTPVGRLEVVLRYTIGVAAVLLSAAALWTATLGVAREMADRRLDLVRIHPVHPAFIWGGKMLGVLAVCTVWVTTLTLLVAVETRSIASAAGNPELNSCRRLLVPDACDTAAENGSVVAIPGRALNWSFTIPANTPANRQMAVVCRFLTARPGAFAVHGKWSLHSFAGEQACATGTTDSVAGRALETPLTGRCPAAGSPVTLRFIHDGGEYNAALAFATGDIQLVLMEPGAAANLVRGMTLLLAQLAVIIALGLTMGTLLSPPVALFTGLALLLVLGMTDSIHTVVRNGIFFIPHDGPVIAPDFIDRLTMDVYRLADALLTPLRALDPLTALGNREWIASGTVVNGLALSLLCVTILALPGIVALRRRQLALLGE